MEEKKYFSIAFKKAVVNEVSSGKISKEQNKKQVKGNIFNN